MSHPKTAKNKELKVTTTATTRPHCNGTRFGSFNGFLLIDLEKILRIYDFICFADM